MSKFASPYYPPRAPWYAALGKLGDAVRRHFHSSRGRRPIGLPASLFVGGLLVPGLAFYVRGSRFWGKVAVAMSGLLLAAFFVWLGYPAGNLAFGLLLSIHSTSIAYLCEPLLADARLRTRIFFSTGALVALGGVLYLPLRSLLQEHCFMPMNVAGHVVVVRAYASAESVHRGDWIAYSLNDAGGQGVYVRAGFGLGPVLALRGDPVRFDKTSFEVNGVRRTRQVHMPDAGELVVPENDWFVWPEVDISGHGNVAQGALSATLLKMSMITKKQFIGKPFKRWFWRRQILS